MRRPVPSNPVRLWEQTVLSVNLRPTFSETENDVDSLTGLLTHGREASKPASRMLHCGYITNVDLKQNTYKHN